MFRRLSLKLHPDCGGEADLMILLQECYENKLKELSPKQTNYPPKNPTNQTHQKFQNVYSDVILGNPALHILPEIFEYAKSHKSFKTDYLDSVYEFLSENGYITSSQYNSLLKTYYAFRMDKK